MINRLLTQSIKQQLSYRCHQRQLFTLALAGFLLAGPVLAEEVFLNRDTSNNNTEAYELMYTDTSLSGALDGIGEPIQQDIIIVNKGAYIIDDVRVIQKCWSVSSAASEIVTRTADSAKRGPDIEINEAARFVAWERDEGMECTYTVRAWIKSGKSHDFEMTGTQKTIYFRGGVNTPSVSRYSYLDLPCSIGEPGYYSRHTSCSQFDSSFALTMTGSWTSRAFELWREGTLQSVHSGKCLEVSGSGTSDSANVQQYQCNGNDNQSVYFMPVAGKTDVYMLMFKHSGKCLDVSGISGSDGANIYQWSCHAGTNQQFKLTSLGDDTYSLTAEHSGRVVDVAAYSTSDGGNIHQWGWHGANNQRWRLNLFRADLFYWPISVITRGSATLSDAGNSYYVSAGLYDNTAFVENAAPTHMQNTHALRLDGSGDYAAFPDPYYLDFAADEDFTVAFWINADTIQPDTHHGTNNVVEKWSGAGGYPFVIRYFNQTHAKNGKVLVARYDGSKNPSITSTVTINDGDFHHVAFVRQGDTLKLFIDGVLDGSAIDTTTGTTSNNSALYLGRRGTSNNPNYFKGAIDDLRIYSYAITDTELAVLIENVARIQVFQHCNYGGNSAELFSLNNPFAQISEYKLELLNAFGIQDNEISSVRVPVGYELTLYQYDNFAGQSITLTQADSCLTNDYDAQLENGNWNDQTSSLRVSERL